MKSAKLFALIPLLFPCTVLADARIEYVDEASNAPTMSVFISGPNLRIDDHGSNTTMLVNTDQRQMININHKSREYLTFSEADLQKLGSAVAEARAQMEAQMANMPAEQRAMMEKMMGQLKNQAGGAAPVITTSGRSDEVAGIRCKVVVYRVANKASELCLAEPNDAGMSTADYNNWLRTAKFIASLAEAMADQVGFEMNLDYSELDGLALRMRDDQRRSIFNSLDSSGLSSATFKVPADYQQRSLP